MTQSDNQPVERTPSGEDLEPLRLEIQGMHCAACVHRIEQALLTVPGVTAVTVSLPLSRARVSHEAGTRSIVDHCLAAISRAGYSAREVVSEDSIASAPSASNQELHDLQRRVWSAIPATLFVVMLHMGPLHLHGSAWWQAVAAAFVLFWCGRSIVSRGLKGLWRFSPDMDSLVALGALTAWSASFVALVLRGFWSNGPEFFEAAATVVCFVLIGRLLELRARRQTVSATEALLQLQPPQATLWMNGEERRVPVASLLPGDLVRIRPGERIPIDGLIDEGRVAVDQSLVTGESLPQTRETGDELLAGTFALEGSALVRVSRPVDATFLRRIVGMVQDAQGSKAPMARLADRIARIFVPGVLVISLLTLCGWLMLGPAVERWNLGILAAVTVLVISCPCALGLATPTALATAMGTAARRGLLFRDGVTLERLAVVDLFLFDKTGTLTTGRFRVSQVLPAQNVAKDELLRLASAVEQRSEHPLARAIVLAYQDSSGAPVQALEPQGLISLGMYTAAPTVDNTSNANAPTANRTPQVTDFRSFVGQGVIANVDGVEVFVGSERFLREQGLDIEAWQEQVEQAAGSGGTAILVGREQSVLGMLVLHDALKPDAGELLDQLRAENLNIGMVTGDRLASARSVGDQLGIQDVFGELLPEDKLEIVRRAQHAGQIVAMVGDGVNDAPVLAAADVGFAIVGGADVARAASGVSVVSGELRSIVVGWRLARETLRVIRQNLAFAFVYNLLGIPLATGMFYPWTGWLLPPMFAAMAMSLSSVSVVLNSLRLRKFGEQTERSLWRSNH